MVIIVSQYDYIQIGLFVIFILLLLVIIERICGKEK